MIGGGFGTDSGRIGNGLRPDWGLIGDGLGTDWGRIDDRFGTNCGQIGDELGDRLGMYWGWIGDGFKRIGNRLGTGWEQIGKGLGMGLKRVRATGHALRTDWGRFWWSLLKQNWMVLSRIEKSLGMTKAKKKNEQKPLQDCFKNIIKEKNKATGTNCRQMCKTHK